MRTWSETISPGGAFVIDVVPEQGYAGNLDITVDAGNDISVTTIAYDDRGHPHVCDRGAGTPTADVEMEQWDVQVTGSGSLQIDPTCRTASIVVVNTQFHRKDHDRTVRVEVAFVDTLAVVGVEDYGGEGTEPSSGWLSSPSGAGGAGATVYADGRTCLRFVFRGTTTQHVGGNSAFYGAVYADGVRIARRWVNGHPGPGLLGPASIEKNVASTAVLTLGWEPIAGIQLDTWGVSVTECAP